MLRLLNNFILIPLYAIFSVSCGFNIYDYIDLRPIGVTIQPNANNSVLPDLYSSVSIKFDTEMKKRDTENTLQISSDLGVMSGEKNWKGNTLYFIPESGWTAGIRYNLNLSGTIRSVDGREMRIEHNVSFYALNNNDPPLLIYYSPLNGASTGINNVVYEYQFSKSMNRLTVESALTLEGIAKNIYEWSDNDKILKIKSDKALSPWNYYRWNLKNTAKSIDGVPLPKTYSGHFKTDLDQILPEITCVYPVLFSDGSWYPTGAGIEAGLNSGQGIAVSFNKPMEENALRSLRFEPSLSGRTEFLSEKSIVYILSKDPEPEIVYTLIISGETKDCQGLKIGSDYKINFSVDIPFLRLLSFTVNDDIVIENFSEINVIPVTVAPATGELSASIRFSLPFKTEEKQKTPQKMILTPIFPRTLSPVALEFVDWVSDDCLFIRWEGLANGDNEIPHYYKITIPGGKNGIVQDNGIYLKEDIILYLEAAE